MRGIRWTKLGAAAAVVTAASLALLRCAGTAPSDVRSSQAGVKGPAGTSRSALLEPGEIRWTRTAGPEGGDFKVIALNPADPDELFSGNRVALYRSGDRAFSWQPVEGFPPAHVTEILFDPADPRVLYVATIHNGIFKSVDGGTSWKPKNRGLVNPHVVELALDSTDPGTLYAGTAWTGRVYRSGDGAENWVDVTGQFEAERITAIVAAAGEVFVGAGGALDGKRGDLYRSRDSGTSWRRLDIGQHSDSFVTSILRGPRDGRELYVAFGDCFNRLTRRMRASYLFKSRDGGESWQPVPGQFNDAFVRLLGVSESAPAALYVATGAYLHRMTDGTGWETLLGGVADPACMRLSCMDFEDIAVDPRDPRRIYLPLAGAGIALSRDGGRSWEHVNRGLLGMSVANLAADPFDSQTLYAGGTPIGIPGTFKTTDGGESWRKLDAGGVYHPFTDELYAHPTIPETVFQIADVGILFRSSDAGESWRAMFDPHHPPAPEFPRETDFQFSSIYALRVAPSDPRVLYAVKNGFGVYKSVDAGVSWRYQIFSPDYSYCLAVDPAEPHLAYSGYQRKVFESASAVYRSAPELEQWKGLASFPDCRGVRWMEVDPRNPRRLYAGVAGTPGRVMVSEDRGESWRCLNEHLTFTTVWGHSQLQVDPRDPRVVYAGTWGGGSFKSTDGGGSWSRLDDAHTFSPTCIAVAPSDPAVMYACDRTAPKIHRSNDGGRSWQTWFDFGDGYMMSSAVAVDPRDPARVYAAAFRRPAALTGSLLEITAGRAVRDLSEGLPRAVLEIELDPSDPETLYVTTHVHGVFQSTNGGRSWIRLDDRGTGLPRTGYYDIDVDPRDRDVLYAAALCGPLPGYMIDAPPVAAALRGEPPGRRNLDAQAACGVYKSTDRGRSWKLILRTASEARGVAIDPADSRRLFAADMVGGVWVSTDAGGTWRQENRGLGSLSMTSVGVSGGQIYAGTQGSGVYAGTVGRDGSIRWDAARSNKPRTEVFSIQIEVDPRDSRRIYASAYPGGLLRSDDGGRSWNDKNFLTPSIRVEDPNIQGYYSFAIDPKDPDTVWLGAHGKGMFVSHDGMDYCMFANGADNRMGGKRITRVAINPREPAEVYAAGEDGVYRTSDGGRSWQALPEGLPTDDVYTLDVAGDGTVYAGTRGYGVYRLDRRDDRWDRCGRLGDFGTFWSTWERPLYQYSDLLIDPENPDRWYLASFPTGLFRSLDGGRTWRESNLGFIDDGTDGIFSLVFHPDDTSILYAGTYNGVSVSHDGGQHWRRISNGIPPEQWPFTVAIDPTNPSILYAATKNGKDKGFCDRHEPPFDFCGTVVKSVDGGESWFQIMNGLPRDLEYYNLILHPRDPATLYVSSSYDGVWMSRDAGASWVMINEGLGNLKAGAANNVATNLVLDAAGEYLYFGTMGSGVWKARVVQ